MNLLIQIFTDPKTVRIQIVMPKSIILDYYYYYHNSKICTRIPTIIMSMFWDFFSLIFVSERLQASRFAYIWGTSDFIDNLRLIILLKALFM